MNRNRSTQKLSKDQEREEQQEINQRYNSNDNFRAVPKQNELKNRLYDKGFSVKTLPSVKRPETSSSTARPMTAKLYSFKNKLTPLIYQPQPTILSPNQTKKGQMGSIQPELMPSASAPKFQTISQSPMINKNLQPEMKLTYEDNNPFSSPND